MKKPKISPHITEDIRQAVIHGVGYRSPPTQHQFKKGQSGNPKGRPRKANPAEMATALNMPQTQRMHDTLREPVAVKTATGPRKMSLGEALQHKHRHIALVEGRTMPLLALKRELRDHEREAHQAIVDDQRKWLDYIKNYRTIEQGMKDTGQVMEGFWILPENIVFHDNAKCRIRGALSEEGKPYFEFLEKFLRLLIFEVTYDCIYFTRPEDPLRAEIKCIAYLRHTVTAAGERASTEYWDWLEQEHVCTFWKSAQAERTKVWADIGLPIPGNRWLKPMPAKDSKLAERHFTPIQKLLMELRFDSQRGRRNCGRNPLV